MAENDYDDLGPPDDTDVGTDTSYHPTRVQATRGREQGLGMGEADLAQQRDATGGSDSENETERLMRTTAPRSPATGLPDTEAQKTPELEPGYPAVDGDEVAPER